MNLHRTAAFLSAASLATFFFIQQFGGSIAQAAPGIMVPLAVVWDAALWLWIAGLAIVVFDTAGLRHPAIGHRSRLAGGAAALVALAAPALLGIGQVAGSFGLVVPIAYLLAFVSVGIMLITHGLATRRAGVQQGALPWLGAVTGLAFVLGGLGGIGFLGGPVLVSLSLVGYQVLMLAQTLYLGWAILIGVHLARSRAIAPALAG